MAAYGEAVHWQPERPRLRPVRLLISWAFTTIALLVAAGILPGVDVGRPGAAILMAVVISVINAIIPLRPEVDDERMGLDLSQHSETAYS